MAILTCSNLGQSYGDYDVFTGVTSSITKDDRIGLVGPNGIGKTTLLRILANETTSSAGSMQLARGTRIGYLRQEAMEAFKGRENTVYTEMLTVFGDIKQQEAHLQKLQEQMATGNGPDAIMAEYSTAHEAFEAAGGYEYEVRISQVLQGLGFGRDDWDIPLGHLSGGQKTRALLARLLLERPDLLILDEPTNHLDVEAIEWLENTLRLWPGALLVVSHDRYFLDKVVNRIWEMSKAGMEVYRGNYTAYVLQRQERWHQRESEFQTIKEKFLKELDFVKRNIARDSTTDRAKGRLRRLIREVRIVEIGGLKELISLSWGKVMEIYPIPIPGWSLMETESHIKSLQGPGIRPPQLHMQFETTQRSGELVLRSSELGIGYPGTVLFTAEPIELRRKECAALIGPNGSGKTTFLNTILEKIEPLAGQLRLGSSLKIGHFAQAHDKLNMENTVIEELIDYQHMLIGDARNYLAKYLFRKDEVYQPIHTLSGGERGRLALALLALDKANLLLLDEPTNHLDIPAQEALQEVLERFDGTILLVSHDRYLIDRLATQVWNLDDGKLHVFEGTYSEFVADRETSAEEARADAAQARATQKKNQRTDRASYYAARRRKQELEKVEAKIQMLETKLEELGVALQAASDAQELTRIQQISETYAATNEKLEATMEEWAELAE